jgi:hypothetical protein
MIMKKIMFIVSLLLLVSSAHADDRILGKWKDKNKLCVYKYEFKENQGFIYTKTYSSGEASTTAGVWEIGLWTITRPDGVKKECELAIYAGEDQCCFEYKFIAGHLILTNIYKPGHGHGMCENRVLIRETKEE